MRASAHILVVDDEPAITDLLSTALRYLGYAEGSLPETERAGRENFSVPLWPSITQDVQEQVVEVVRSAVKATVPS